MKRLAKIVLLLALSTYAHADEEMWIGVKCNPSTDRLTVYYFTPAAIDDHGSMAKKGPNEWAVSDLLSVEDGQYEIHGATRVCELSHGRYTVSIESDPDNLNPNGECGAAVSVLVDIRRGNESILTRHRLDSERCNRLDGVTTTRIVVDAKSPIPRLTSKPTYAP